jgi:hypothetical protein
MIGIEQIEIFTDGNTTHFEMRKTVELKGNALAP